MPRNRLRPPGTREVRMWEEAMTIPTYVVPPPDPNPMFLEKRVFQGSKGTVYPLPVTDRVSDERVERSHTAVYLDNDYIRVMVLPEFGGRIHAGLDKTNNYDFIYRNDVIKPALVGLAGPWLSGGIEFNWPQHHRPTTFMPVDHILEEHTDGSKTVWVGEIEPFNRMKGMAGITLHPGRSYIDVTVQLYNRTPVPQTFLWWANLAVHVNDQYQAIFPPDVHFVADHAKRAISTFPIAHEPYYGVDYARGVDISWFKNIPVPTSYMALDSRYDFLGGYDHGKQAGVIHVANHHIAPGKKLWTWGAGQFGATWYNQLTDGSGPYVELMTGVYTDNQPDFSWLQPYETKTFTQIWYPIRDIGAVKQATLDAAVNLDAREDSVFIGLNTTARFTDATVALRDARRVLWQETLDIAPDRPVSKELSLRASDYQPPLSVALCAADGRELVSYTTRESAESAVPQPATAAPAPEAIGTTDELYLTGLHLEQYRHATYDPDPYYEEALRRDPGDARANNALGLVHLRRGAFETAAAHFRQAIARLTEKNPNPYDGEPFYNLGLALRFLEHDVEAYDTLYKATWTYAWQAPAYYLLAELDGRAGRFSDALAHVNRSLHTQTLNTKARNLKTAVLRMVGRLDEAEEMARGTVEMDMLDFWSRNELYLLQLQRGSDDAARHQRDELAQLMRNHAPSYLDLASDYAGAGLWQDAIDVLTRLTERAEPVADPLVYYYLGYFAERRDDQEAASRSYGRAADMPPDYCFPNRLDTIAVLRRAQHANPRDARGPYYLGNLFYDKRQYTEAIRSWERSRELDPGFSIVHRNLGLAYVNVAHDLLKARGAFAQAVTVNPRDARLLYEHDQLEKRLGASPQERLARLEARRDLVEQRDDLSLERVTLYNQLGQYDTALALLASRRFHPWEGGEGKVTEQYVLGHLLRGQVHLRQGQQRVALEDFLAAATYPDNLGEGKHDVLTSEARVFYAIGMAYEALGEAQMAADYYRRASEENEPGAEAAYYAGLAYRQLGKTHDAERAFRALIASGTERLRGETGIDYFATSLPTFLLFEDDVATRNAIDAHYLRGLGYAGLGQTRDAGVEFEAVLALDINHLGAHTQRSDIHEGQRLEGGGREQA